jgi:eukaryotic-like serine/threonine-protein kinase
MRPRKKRTTEILREDLASHLRSLRALEKHLGDPDPETSGPQGFRGLLRRTLAIDSPRARAARGHRLDPMATICLPPGTELDSAIAGFPADLQHELEALTMVLPERYGLGRLLGSGGMGAVYWAVDHVEKARVAVKLLATSCPDLIQHATEIARGLRHPAVQPVHDSGFLGKRGFFLVMPCYRGVTLRDILLQGAKTRSLVLLVRKACEGVAHAHSQGVIHRDLKPANIFLDHEGKVVVLDWDLACHAGDESRWSGGIIGTPLYMAPEQVEGRTVGPATDVHALGTILYQVLTGRNPARSTGIQEVFQRIRSERPPPPSALQAGVSPELDRLVLRCLEKDPAKRLPDAGALVEELEGLPQDR